MRADGRFADEDGGVKRPTAMKLETARSSERREVPNGANSRTAIDSLLTS